MDERYGREMDTGGGREGIQMYRNNREHRLTASFIKTGSQITLANGFQLAGLPVLLPIFASSLNA